MFFFYFSSYTKIWREHHKSTIHCVVLINQLQ